MRALMFLLLVVFLGCAEPAPVDVDFEDVIVQPGNVVGGEGIDAIEWTETGSNFNAVLSTAPTTLTIGDDVVEIDLGTGRVRTSLPMYDGALTFWHAVATAYPEAKKSICGGDHAP